MSNTLLQRLRDVPTVVQPESPPFVPIRPETRDAVVALIETVQAVEKDVVAWGMILRAALVPFTEERP